MALSTEKRSRIMRSIRGKDTGPELIVRKLAHSLGYRYRIHRKDLPGSPDLVFPRHRLAIFVHGCFWHQHAGCRHGKLPKTRPEYWLPKLERTKERDRLAVDALQEMGWRTLIIWECETGNREILKSHLQAKISSCKP